MNHYLVIIPIALIVLCSCLPLAFSWYRANHPKVAPPAPSKAPEPPLPELPISCFVKGLIASLETEPEKWGYADETPRVSDFYVPCHTYIKGGIIVTLSWGLPDITGNVNYHAVIFAPRTSLNRTESAALTKTLTVTHLAKVAADYAAQEAANAALRALFEALGCPKTP